MKYSFSDKIIVFNTTKAEINEIEIGDGFDILSPTLTPIGIIFTNRIDSKIYFVPRENLSF